SVMKSRRLISSPQPEDRAPYHTVVGNAPLCITTNLAANVRDRSNSTELAEVTTSIYDRGRDASCLAPPAQIRTCPAFLVKGASRHFCCSLLLHSLFDPRREHSFVPTAYYRRRRAQ